jgi:hypothetical protein
MNTGVSRRSIHLLRVFVLAVVVAGCLAWWQTRNKPVAPPGPAPANTNQMLRALANYGFTRSGRAHNTFFIPPKPNFGEHYVIYWKEENLLFTFPAEQITPEAVDAPALVINRAWTADSQNFRLRGDPEAQTSTYLEYWDWALQRLFEAVAQGEMHVLSPEPKPAK